MNSVVIPHDGSASMEATLSWLVPFFGRSKAQVELCPLSESRAPSASDALESLVSRLREAGATPTTRAQLPDLLNSESGRLVVLHGDTQLALQLLRQSKASLFVCPQGLEPLPPRRMLVPLDGSRKAEEILPLVASFTEAFGAEVELLRIAPDETSEGALKARPEQVTTRLSLTRSLDRARQLFEEQGTKVRVRIKEHGSLHGRILEAARGCGADLIATSTHGHGRLARLLLGSCAESLLRRSHVPLLIRNAKS